MRIWGNQNRKVIYSKTPSNLDRYFVNFCKDFNAHWINVAKVFSTVEG